MSYIVETLRVPGVFILRLNTPIRASLHLNRTKCSNRRKATLEEGFTSDDKGLCGSTRKAYKTATPMTTPEERSSLRWKRQVRIAMSRPTHLAWI
jgi:hypothetical protein